MDAVFAYLSAWEEPGIMLLDDGTLAIDLDVVATVLVLRWYNPTLEPGTRFLERVKPRLRCLYCRKVIVRFIRHYLSPS